MCKESLLGTGPGPYISPSGEHRVVGPLRLPRLAHLLPARGPHDPQVVLGLVRLAVAPLGGQRPVYLPAQLEEPGPVRVEPGYWAIPLPPDAHDAPGGADVEVRDLMLGATVGFASHQSPSNDAPQQAAQGSALWTLYALLRGCGGVGWGLSRTGALG